MIAGKLIDGTFLLLCIFIVVGTFPETVTNKVSNTVTETGYETKKVLEKMLNNDKDAKEKPKSN